MKTNFTYFGLGAIALTTARAFGVDPTPFVMIVAYGASAGAAMPSQFHTMFESQPPPTMIVGRTAVSYPGARTK